MQKLLCCLALAGILLVEGRLASGQQADPAPPTTDSAKPEEPQPADDPEAKFRKFKEMMSDVRLVGRFTMLGRDPAQLPTEEYTIRSVQKLPRGDYWLINARIKYGNHDLTVPLPLEIKWAGDTPVITLSDFAIPGLGKAFGARVVLDDGKYAGTWRHGEVSGHMFGTIEKLKPESE